MTPDHVNPEAPWPQLERARTRDRRRRQGADRAARDLSGLCRDTRSAGSTPALRRAVLRAVDADGFAARPTPGSPGAADRAAAGCRGRPRAGRMPTPRSSIERGCRGARPRAKREIVALFAARGDDFRRRVRRRRRAARRALRRRRHLRRQPQHQLHQHLLPTAAGSAPSPRASRSENLRGGPYDLDLDEIAARARGLGARRHRSLPAGRHPPALHRRDLSRDLPRREGGGAATCTSTPSRRSRCRRARRRSA